MRYAVLLFASLALVVAWTAVDWDGPNSPRVPAIELSLQEREGGRQPRRTKARRSERGETARSSAERGGGAAPAPGPQPQPAGDDDAEDRDDGDDGDADDGDDGDDGDD